MRNLFNPVAFQGEGRKKAYFEGYYLKHVSRSGQAWAFIPGVSISSDGSVRKSFIQVIDGSTGTTRWYEFPFESFKYSARRFEVSIEGNRFSASGMHLELSGPDGAIAGDLRYGRLLGFPARPWCPGIMGPYSFLPAMECNHGLVSLDHEIAGGLSVDGLPMDFDGGRGYIEKDWGRAMPSSWIWAQSNSFPEAGTSLMFSLANIPWRGASFPGFLCAFRSGANGAMNVLATWTGARIENLGLSDASITVVISSRRDRLELLLERGRGGLLLAPVAGAMERRIAESVDATMQFAWYRQGSLLYQGRANPSGLETVGAVEQLMPDTRR